MKIAFLFGLFPKEIYSEIIDNSRGVIQYAADALQKSFVEGLGSLNTNIEIFNLPYIGSYPLRYNSLYSPFTCIEYVTQKGNVISGKNIRFCNFMGFKMYSRYYNARKNLKEWCDNNNREERVIVIYAIHTPFLKACIELKKQYGASLKIVLIIPDLPEYMGGQKSFLSEYVHKQNRRFLKKLYFEIDGFVLLTEHMKEMLPIEDKKWTIVEGIFNNIQDDTEKIDQVIDSKISYIFYSGTLAKRYGVMNLVEAFLMLVDTNIRLVICGTGDAENEILDYVKNDKRIIFRGQIPRAEVLKLQRKASLLVNPRTPEGEFTKYSFPSKTMEYLASGVPTLLYKLPGIPDEYYQYCFSLEDLSIKALANKITDILGLDCNELRKIGLEARNFILDRKNPVVQCEKVMKLINSLM
ncbi:glycosyltransferase [Bacteroides sp.]|uniref:glycosyltransferase n=1 Tax=Bacteroides sp. TaxID=29523 RepID=UPI0025BF3906|nr:glycosyltransferase [Bacteroides sp.]